MQYFACDDTYGPSEADNEFITGDRKTYIGIEIRFLKLRELRIEIAKFLNEINSIIPGIERFHFSDIFNRRNVWHGYDALSKRVFLKFCDILINYHVEAFVQTIQNYTLNEHPEEYLKLDEFSKNPFGINVRTKDGMALMLLLVKVINSIRERGNATIIIDQGIHSGGKEIKFSHNSRNIVMKFESSIEFPELQLADFFAFMLNRSNYLQTKTSLSEADKIFLNYWKEISYYVYTKDLMMIKFRGPNGFMSATKKAQIEGRKAKNLQSIPDKYPKW